MILFKSIIYNPLSRRGIFRSASSTHSLGNEIEKYYKRNRELLNKARYIRGAENDDG